MTDKTTIGSIKVISLLDGNFESSVDRIVGLEPDQIQALLDAGGPAPLTLANNVFLVKLKTGNALIDAGAGNTMGPTLGKLTSSLQRVGLTPDEIDHVVLTHLHKDHFGGLIDTDGAAVFKNAELILHETEAAFWLDRPASDFAPRAQRYLDITNAAVKPYRQRLRLVSDGDGLPGLSASLAPGHTPGHTAWILSDTGQAAVFWGDLIHVGALHLPRPETVMVYDLDPDLAYKSRIKFLNWVAEKDVLVASSHLDAPGLGRIKKSGGGFEFIPLENAD